MFDLLTSLKDLIYVFSKLWNVLLRMYTSIYEKITFRIYFRWLKQSYYIHSIGINKIEHEWIIKKKKKKIYL